MSIVTFFLMLAVAAAIVWGVLKALEGNWRELIIGIVVLLVALWILGALGVTLPSLPSVR